MGCKRLLFGKGCRYLHLLSKPTPKNEKKAQKKKYKFDCTPLGFGSEIREQQDRRKSKQKKSVVRTRKNVHVEDKKKRENKENKRNEKQGK